MIHSILKKYWGYDSFRPLQEEIIRSVLDGHDTLGILPTGGGKSITFQVPGMILEGLVIVVTPLISLMKDQVDNLRKRKIKATYLHSGMTPRERRLAYERIFNDKVKFLYISPERIGDGYFIRDLSRLKIALIAVDEAHCISQWGYDFRPSYLKIKQLRKHFPVPVLALTASATKEVADDICLQLEFSPDFRIFRGSITRENLSYTVRPSEAKLSDILQILTAMEGSAIIYVRSRKKTREISEYLNNFEISASFYHAGLETQIKEERQNLWKDGTIRVMVATNAFGMGIDKPDVRLVVHYDMPPSLEEYYQEAGRAGRDGLKAYAILLTAQTDKSVLHRRLTMEFPPKDVIKRIYTLLCVFSHLEIGEGNDTIKEFDLLKFCHIFEISEAVLRPSLRILGQAGYVSFIEETENSSRVMVTVDREELYRVKLSERDQERVLGTLLRNYPGLFADYVFINETRLSLLSGLQPENIYNRLAELSKKKILHYIPRRKTPLLYFHTAMEEERYVKIGKEVYEDRKEVMSRRIEAMISYAYSDGRCRLDIMKSYFGEEGSGNCGTCDTCRAKARRWQKLSDRELAAKLNSLFSNSPEGVTRDEVAAEFGEQLEDAENLLRLLQEDGRARLSGNKWILNR